MNWYQKQPKTTKDFAELTQTYNEKYGDYDYSKDARQLDKKFETILIKSVGNIKNKKVIVCGSNSGHEIHLLIKHYPTATFTALDISSEALQKLKQNLPVVNCIHASMESLPFDDNEFDVYINCRAIHSSNVDMRQTIDEATRVTKNKIVISISNGYLLNNKVIPGMFDYRKNMIDRQKPTIIEARIKKILTSKKYRVSTLSSESEIFLKAS